MILDRDTLIVILRAHRCTLGIITLNCLGFHHGTWHEPIDCLTTMTKLRGLLLSDILEEDSYSQVQGPINAYTKNPLAIDKWPSPGLVLYVGSGTSLDSMKKILDVLLSNFHTYGAYAVAHSSTKKFAHRVDLREAAAIANRTG